MDTTDPYVRANIVACADCGQTETSYAYLQDGQHYCVRCARKLLVTAKLRPAGRREDDLSYEDVLFTNLPYSPDPGKPASSPASPDAHGVVADEIVEVQERH